MSLPPAVSRYVYSLDKRFRHAVCLLVDDERNLRDCWGDTAEIFPVNCRIGDCIDAIVPVLHNLDFQNDAILKLVEISPGKIFDIHMFSEGSDRFVLLVPEKEQHDRKQELQQVANEVRLLNKTQATLLNKLEQATIELEEKRDEAYRASSVKTRFIASMSHEFRTPLTSVIGYTELLLADAHENSDFMVHATAIGRAARHLLSMVDNILDQARIEEGNVAIREAPLNVRQVTDDITAMLAPLAAEKSLAFGAYVDAGVPRAVYTDEVRLRQILVNLVGNAIKFTDEGEVRVEFSWADEQLTIDVFDTGPGIPKDQQEAIFDAFHRVNAIDHKRGTGLGLNITMRLVELLQGSIKLESEPGKGSHFRVRIKAPKTSDAVASEGPYGHHEVLEKSSGEKRRVLIAEDDPDLRALLNVFLTRGGYELLQACDGKEAVTMALSEQPDLVLMDVNMPNLDGLSAARELRANGFRQPVIALTASLSVQDRDQAFHWGCDGYLVKPITLPELLSAVERYLENADRLITEQTH